MTFILTALFCKMANARVIGSFMRSYGLKVFYFIYVFCWMAMYLSYIIPDDSQKPVPPRYDLYRRIWLSIFRIGGVLLFLPSLCFMSLYLFAKLPEVAEGPDTNLKPGHIPVQNGKKTVAPIKGRLSCFIIRIITRGDYPELIRRNAAYHIDLLEKYAQCDRLECHIVTEKSIDGDYKLGVNGRVREIIVPANYRSNNGALYKARNMAYWVAHRPQDDSYPSDDQTWILSLDEDSFITESFMVDFFKTFLPSGAHCSVSPSLLELPPTTTSGLLNGFEESFFITLQAMGSWVECFGLKFTPIWFRGAAYVVRADVDKAIGHDYTPELSVTEDHVFGHYFCDSPYKIGYINGWNWEGGAPDLLGLIKQRGRWFRGHMYAFLYQNMSFGRRFSCGLRFFLFYIVNVAVMVNGVVATVIWFSGHWSFLWPADSRCWMDYLSTFAFATYFYANIYGAWHIMSTKKAALYTLGTCLWVGAVATMVIHLSELAWTVITLIDDFRHGRRRYEVTEKKVD